MITHLWPVHIIAKDQQALQMAHFGIDDASKSVEK